MTAANSSLTCAAGIECWLCRFRRMVAIRLVICVVHAAFTIITVLRKRRPMAFHQIAIEEHGSIGSQLREFPPQIALF
jgi:hypothetical protein